MATTGWRVLVVDDEDSVRNSITEMLMVTGNTVLAALACGEDAVEQVARQQPDIVLMDIQMPGIGGIEAARRIRALPNPAPVVFLTAFGDQMTVQDAARAGSFGYLVKPFHMRQLGPVMETAIERFREWMQMRRQQAAPDEVLPLIGQFGAKLRESSLADTVAAVLAAIGAQMQAAGVALCLETGNMPEARPAAEWGETLGADALGWIASIASVRQPCQSPAGALAAESPALAAAPLHRDGELPGVLVVWAAAPRAFTGEEMRRLNEYAAALGETLLATRLQLPIAWRRWLYAGRH